MPEHFFASAPRNGGIRLAVCILHYGNPALTARLHRQFMQAEPKRAADIMVLDNAAPDAYPESWHRFAENRFWPGAFDWALKTLEQAGYTHLWFCNNDAELVSAAPYLARMEMRIQWQEKESGRVGVVSPALTQNPYHEHMVWKEGAQCLAVPYIDGVAPIVNMAAVREVGGLDFSDNPYGYGVDIWLAVRLARAGWQVQVDHAVVMRHRYHTTANTVEGYISQAARYENDYLSKRLGSGWRECLARMRAGSGV